MNTAIVLVLVSSVSVMATDTLSTAEYDAVKDLLDNCVGVPGYAYLHGEVWAAYEADPELKEARWGSMTEEELEENLEYEHMLAALQGMLGRISDNLDDLAAAETMFKGEVKDGACHLCFTDDGILAIKEAVTAIGDAAADANLGTGLATVSSYTIDKLYEEMQADPCDRPHCSLYRPLM